jgi:hypothetical protein
MSDTLWFLDNHDSIFGNAEITFNNPTTSRGKFRAKQDSQNPT